MGKDLKVTNVEAYRLKEGKHENPPVQDQQCGPDGYAAYNAGSYYPENGCKDYRKNKDKK